MLLWLLALCAQARTLTVTDAVELALDHSHTVDASEAAEVKARAELAQSFLQFFPRVGLSSGYTRLDQVPYVTFDMSSMTGSTGGDPCADIDEDSVPEGWTVEAAQGMCNMIMGWMAPSTDGEPSQIAMGLQDNYFVRLQAEEVLFAGGARWQAHRAYRDLHQASLHGVRQSRHQVAYDASQSFYTLMLAREAVAVAEDGVASMEAYVGDLQAVVDVGAGNRADLLAAQAQLSQARLEALRARHGADLAELALVVTLGLDRGEELELVLSDPPPLDEPGVDALLDEAWAHRPDLASVDANLRAMDHLAGAAWASWLPAIVLQGNLNWKNPNYALEPEWYSSADLTVAASWTLWDRGQALQGHRAAVAGLRQVQSQRELLAEMMAVEVEAAVRSWEEAGTELEVARVGLEQAEEAYRLEHERFTQGMANNTQLLAAHTARSTARLSVLQAETQLRISRAAIDKALGRDPQVTR